MSTIHLLNETLAILSENALGPSDVRFVAVLPLSENMQYTSELGTWEDFAALCREYENGFGGAEVNENLVVVGDDWWLERHEYDGSEWWEFKRLPAKPTTTKPLKRVFDVYDEDENEDEGEDP